MKPEDLRIGNYTEQGIVHTMGMVDGKYCFGILDNEFSSFSNWISPDKLKPIPITEQWLLDFGFKQIDKYTWVKKRWFVYKRKRGFLTESKKREIKLPYVHTLQNWYVLTGEELIKNK